MNILTSFSELTNRMLLFLFCFTGNTTDFKQNIDNKYAMLAEIVMG